MSLATKLTDAEHKLKRQLKEVRAAEKGVVPSQTINQSQADLMARKRASERDLKPDDVKHPEDRLKYESDDRAWLEYYLGHVYTKPLAEDRLENIRQMRYCVDYGVRKCIAAPRGSGKTTDFRGILIKDALSGKLPFGFLVSASAPKASESENAIREAVEGAMPGSPLFEDYPFECAVIQDVAKAPARQRTLTVFGMDVHVRWSHNAPMIFPSIRDASADPDELWRRWMIVPNKLGAILSCCGITSSILQGSNVLNIRPSILGMDDVDDRESSDLEAGRMAEKIEKIIDKSIAGMGGQGCSMGQVMLCTVPSRNSVAFIYSDPQQKPAWDGIRIPRIKVWPKQMDLWDEYVRLKGEGILKLGDDERPVDKFGRNAHAYYVANRAAMDEDAEVYDEYDFDPTPLPDGTPKQISAPQKCFDYIAEVGKDSFDTEHQQKPPKRDEHLETKVSSYHVANCAGDYERRMVDLSTSMVVRGVDVRKTELHQVTMATDGVFRHKIADYELHKHGFGSETTVEQAEREILLGLRVMADEWKTHPLFDDNGTNHSTDLTLIDKGWYGSWKTEDGVPKTWASQPVELFCMEMGLRNWLPAKAHPRGYKSPAPSREVIIGDNWHINRGVGGERKCDEVIWSSSHWHMLVEELFMLEDGDPDKFVLFAPGDGLHTNHKAFGEHMTVGATEMKKDLSRGTQSHKPKFVRNHFWDSAAMALVAQSVEAELRTRGTRRRKKMSLAEMSGRAK